MKLPIYLEEVVSYKLSDPIMDIQEIQLMDDILIKLLLDKDTFEIEVTFHESFGNNILCVADDRGLVSTPIPQAISGMGGYKLTKG